MAVIITSAQSGIKCKQHSIVLYNKDSHLNRECRAFSCLPYELKISLVSTSAVTLHNMMEDVNTYNINTYNQVARLEANGLKQLFWILIALLITTITSTIVVFIHYPEYRAAALPITGIVALLSLTTWFRAGKVKLKCRHCRQELKPLVRPFTFNERYLAMRGIKEGDFFYTLTGSSKKAARPVRLSRQTLVCHHCRLVQQGHRVLTEQLSESEWQALKSRHPEHSLTIHPQESK